MEIHKIKVDSALTIFVFMASVSMGFAYIFMLDRELFLKMEIIRLSVLALSIPSVLIVLNCVVAIPIFVQFSNDGMRRGQALNVVVFAASCLAVLTLGLSLMIFRDDKDFHAHPLTYIARSEVLSVLVIIFQATANHLQRPR